MLVIIAYGGGTSLNGVPLTSTRLYVALLDVRFHPDSVVASSSDCRLSLFRWWWNVTLSCSSPCAPASLVYYRAHDVCSSSFICSSSLLLDDFMIVLMVLILMLVLHTHVRPFFVLRTTPRWNRRRVTVGYSLAC
jgi:hypothetical protein